MKKIRAKTPGGGYDIVIGGGALEILPGILGEHSGESNAIIISRRVLALHRDYIAAALKEMMNTEFFSYGDSEKNKCYREAEKFFNSFAAEGIGRRSIVTAMGGGVTGDFAGYISAAYMRGTPFVQVPTTLLAMVDSSIGGKVAVNISRGKNMVGAFHEPRMVICDTAFLETLSDREWKNGLSEVLKHGLIGEGKTLEMLESCDPGEIRERGVIEKIIYLSARFKSTVVARDPHEKGLRAILNFGHTVGHAIESATRHRAVTHGKAVAAGIRAAAALSLRMKLLGKKEAKRINNIIDKFGLMGDNLKIDIPELVEHMHYDKKNSGGFINFVLLQGIGNPVYNCRVPDRLLRDALAAVFPPTS